MHAKPWKSVLWFFDVCLANAVQVKALIKGEKLNVEQEKSP
jgi:hypothetical protein